MDCAAELRRRPKHWGGPASQTIWFAPLDPAFRPEVNYSGSVDYLDLFSHSAPWQTAASHVQVFKIYTNLIDYFSDDDLRRIFADLDRRGIALAVEFGPLGPENCGGGEGFTGANAQHVASRLQQTGGKPRYIAMDEPFYNGNISNGYDPSYGNSACHWTPEKVASNALAHIALIRQVFPDVQVGDIEPLPILELGIPDWPLRYRAWMDAWKAPPGRHSRSFIPTSTGRAPTGEIASTLFAAMRPSAAFHSASSTTAWALK
jgi:hypothetical protein